MAVNTTYSLCSLTELQDYLAAEDGGFSTDVNLVPVLENIIDGVSRWFHEYTGRQLKEAEITEYYDGDGTTLLYLSSYPVLASDIYIDADHNFGAETEITPEMIVDNEVYYSGGFPRYHRNIKVTYTAGFSDEAGDHTPIPSDLKNACLMMCQVMHRSQTKGTSGVGQVSIAGTSFQLHVEKLAPPFVMDILRRYSRA